MIGLSEISKIFNIPNDTNINVFVMEKNNVNIILISISIILSLILLCVICLFVYGKLNGSLFNIIFIVLLFCYILLFLYGFNWFYIRQDNLVDKCIQDFWTSAPVMSEWNV